MNLDYIRTAYESFVNKKTRKMFFYNRRCYDIHFYRNQKRRTF